MLQASPALICDHLGNPPDGCLTAQSHVRTDAAGEAGRIGLGKDSFVPFCFGEIVGEPMKEAGGLH